MATCRDDVERFVAATTAYRDCLERQIAAAMHKANDVLDSFRRRSPLPPPYTAAKDR
jgi:hypothetical protein